MLTAMCCMSRREGGDYLLPDGYVNLLASEMAIPVDHLVVRMRKMIAKGFVLWDEHTRSFSLKRTSYEKQGEDTTAIRLAVN